MAKLSTTPTLRQLYPLAYRSWMNMKQRCLNPRSRSYHNYGGRGITICLRWRDFSAFVQDMGERPSAKHSLERLDNMRGYEPGNCVWALPRQQSRNKRTTVWVMWKGKRKKLAELCDEYAIRLPVVHGRLGANWRLLDALTVPDGGDRPEVLMDRRYAPSMTPPHRLPSLGYQVGGQNMLRGMTERDSEYWTIIRPDEFEK